MGSSTLTLTLTRCVPVFVDHKYVCLPHFIIGGVPKAG